MFANCQMGGISIATPDVCTTPVGPSVVPIPYPNIAQNAMADPSTAVQKVLISGAPAHTLQTIVPTSSGDEAGVIGGVMSGMIMGQRRHLEGASNVLIGGMPATRMTDPTGQNGSSFNVQGSTMTPSQTKVIINSGGSSGGNSASQAMQNSSEQNSDVTVNNLRWEHDSKSAKENRPKKIHVGDIVCLKVDVQNAPPRGARVRFELFIDANNTSTYPVATGDVVNGVGTATWKVKDPRSSANDSVLSIKFSAYVLGVETGKADLPVTDVAPTLILNDSVGPEAAPLMYTDWKLLSQQKVIASGTTNDKGEAALPNQLRAGKDYELRFAGRSINLLALYQDQLEDPGTPQGARSRLTMLGYNCGNEVGMFGPFTKAALSGYRLDKALGVGECDAETTDHLDTDIGVKKK